jgi:hypothetical protein
MVNQAFNGARASGCIRANSISRFRVMMCTRLKVSQNEIFVKHMMKESGVRNHSHFGINKETDTLNSWAAKA